MHIGEIIGGVTLVGVAVLVGIALTDDAAPEIITADTSPFVFDTSASTSTSTSSSTVPVDSAPRTTTPVRTTAPSPAPTAAPTSADPADPTTTTTLIPPELRGGIAVRVLNGGAPARAATNTSELLRALGFAPAGPADARRTVPATRVIFAPGRDVDAATVNDVIKARPENVVPASIDDPNWAEFGGGLAVLVVLGPPGT